MKKLLSVILILMIALMHLGSAAGDTHDTSLQIKAYKVKSSTEKFLNLSVTDSITDGSQLNTIVGTEATASAGDNPVIGEVVLDEFIGTGNGQLIGTLPASGAISKDVTYGRIIFSYRVEGNYEGSFEVGISISPFTNENGNVVNAYYDLRNKSLGLNGVSIVPVAEDTKRTTEYTDSSGKKWYLSFDTADTYTTVIDASEELISKWSVSGGNTTSGDQLDRTWIAREAVYAVVDRSTFDNAPEGSYKAYVTVSVKDNS